MSSRNVLADDSLLSVLDRWFHRLEAPLTLISGITILGIMILSVVNVLGRKFLNIPVPGYIDWMQQLVPLAAFLGLSYVQRFGGHIRMDIIIGRLRGRAIWAFEFVSVLLILFVGIALTYGSYDHFARGLRNGDSTIDINLPTWPAKALVPFVMTLLIIRLLLQLWAYGRAFIRGEERPAAVPLIESAAEQAAAEAATVSGRDI